MKNLVVILIILISITSHVIAADAPVSESANVANPTTDSETTASKVTAPKTIDTKTIDTETKMLTAEQLAPIKTAMQRLVDRKAIPGGLTMISHRGQIVYFDTVGHQNIEDNLPMRKDTVFRVYSMTKPVTSVAALILVERGQLSLDDPLSKFDERFANTKVHTGGFGSFAKSEPARQPITVQHLLSHTAGFTYGAFGVSEVDRLYRTHSIGRRKDTLEVNCGRLAELPLVHHPGEKFRYSVSSDVLGHVIERATGVTLDKVFADEIFEPLGMVDTGFHLSPEKVDRLSATYGPRLLEKGLSRLDDPATSRYLKPSPMLSGGAGLVSTATDYMKFCQMLLANGKYDGGQLLKPETVALMSRNHVPENTLPISIGMPFDGVGFGFGVSVRYARVPYAKYIPEKEYGWSGIASTTFAISAKHDLAMVTMTQYIPYTSALSDRVKKIVYTALGE